MGYINLIRLRQWYKNLLVFLAIFFSGNLLNSSMFFDSVIAFFSVSLIASSYYIINDFIDLKKDMKHPEKKKRSLAAGEVSRFIAGLLIVVLLLLGIYLAYTISMNFLFIMIFLFILGIIYSLILKKIFLADVLSISTLFVIRAIAGAIAIDVFISPWLVLVPFFLALFLSIGKRHADIHLLKENAPSTRNVLKEYSKGLTKPFMIISTTLLIISYAFYSFLSEQNNLLYTLPFALFIIFRFYYLINIGSVIARHPEKIFKDKGMIIGILLWIVITTMLIYY